MHGARRPRKSNKQPQGGAGFGFAGLSSASSTGDKIQGVITGVARAVESAAVPAPSSDVASVDSNNTDDPALSVPLHAPLTSRWRASRSATSSQAGSPSRGTRTSARPPASAIDDDWGNLLNDSSTPKKRSKRKSHHREPIQTIQLTGSSSNESTPKHESKASVSASPSSNELKTSSTTDSFAVAGESQPGHDLPSSSTLAKTAKANNQTAEANDYFHMNKKSDTLSTLEPNDSPTVEHMSKVKSSQAANKSALTAENPREAISLKAASDSSSAKGTPDMKALRTANDSVSVTSTPNVMTLQIASDSADVKRTPEATVSKHRDDSIPSKGGNEVLTEASHVQSMLKIDRESELGEVDSTEDKPNTNSSVPSSPIIGKNSSKPVEAVARNDSRSTEKPPESAVSTVLDSSSPGNNADAISIEHNKLVPDDVGLNDSDASHDSSMPIGNAAKSSTVHITEEAAEDTFAESSPSIVPKSSHESTPLGLSASSDLNEALEGTSMQPQTSLETGTPKIEIVGKSSHAVADESCTPICEATQKMSDLPGGSDDVPDVSDIPAFMSGWSGASGWGDELDLDLDDDDGDEAEDIAVDAWDVGDVRSSDPPPEVKDDSSDPVEGNSAPDSPSENKAKDNVPGDDSVNVWDNTGFKSEAKSGLEQASGTAIEAELTVHEMVTESNLDAGETIDQSTNDAQNVELPSNDARVQPDETFAPVTEIVEDGSGLTADHNPTDSAEPLQSHIGWGWDETNSSGWSWGQSDQTISHNDDPYAPAGTPVTNVIEQVKSDAPDSSHAAWASTASLPANQEQANLHESGAWAWESSRQQSGDISEPRDPARGLEFESTDFKDSDISKPVAAEASSNTRIDLDSEHVNPSEPSAWSWKSSNEMYSHVDDADNNFAPWTEASDPTSHSISNNADPTMTVTSSVVQSATEVKEINRDEPAFNRHDFEAFEPRTEASDPETSLSGIDPDINRESSFTQSTKQVWEKVDTQNSGQKDVTAQASLQGTMHESTEAVRSTGLTDSSSTTNPTNLEILRPLTEADSMSQSVDSAANTVQEAPTDFSDGTLARKPDNTRASAPDADTSDFAESWMALQAQSWDWEVHNDSKEQETDQSPEEFSFAPVDENAVHGQIPASTTIETDSANMEQPLDNVNEQATDSWAWAEDAETNVKAVSTDPKLDIASSFAPVEESNKSSARESTGTSNTGGGPLPDTTESINNIVEGWNYNVVPEPSAEAWGWHGSGEVSKTDDSQIDEPPGSTPVEDASKVPVEPTVSWAAMSEQAPTADLNSAELASSYAYPIPSGPLSNAAYPREPVQSFMGSDKTEWYRAPPVPDISSEANLFREQPTAHVSSQPAQEAFETVGEASQVASVAAAFSSSAWGSSDVQFNQWDSGISDGPNTFVFDAPNSDANESNAVPVHEPSQSLSVDSPMLRASSDVSAKSHQDGIQLSIVNSGTKIQMNDRAELNSQSATNDAENKNALAEPTKVDDSASSIANVSLPRLAEQTPTVQESEASSRTEAEPTNASTADSDGAGFAESWMALQSSAWNWEVPEDAKNSEEIGGHSEFSYNPVVEAEDNSSAHRGTAPKHDQPAAQFQTVPESLEAVSPVQAEEPVSGSVLAAVSETTYDIASQGILESSLSVRDAGEAESRSETNAQSHEVVPPVASVPSVRLQEDQSNLISSEKASVEPGPQKEGTELSAWESYNNLETSQQPGLHEPFFRADNPHDANVSVQDSFEIGSIQQDAAPQSFSYEPADNFSDYAPVKENNDVSSSVSAAPVTIPKETTQLRRTETPPPQTTSETVEGRDPYAPASSNTMNYYAEVPGADAWSIDNTGIPHGESGSRSASNANSYLPFQPKVPEKASESHAHSAVSASITSEDVWSAYASSDLPNVYAPLNPVVPDKSDTINQSFDLSFTIMDSSTPDDRRAPRALISWGFGGSLVTITKRQLDTYSDLSKQDNTQTKVAIFDMSAIARDSVCNEWTAALETVSVSTLSESSLTSYAQMCEKLASYSLGSNRQSSESISFLWRFLAVMCRNPRGNWNIELSKVLTGPVSVPLFDLGSNGSSSEVVKDSPLRATGTDVGRSVSEQARAASHIERLLCSGNRVEAVNLAQDAGLWPLALVISSSMSREFFMKSISEYARESLLDGTALQTLCLSISDNDDQLAELSTTPEGVKNWKKTVSVLLNRSSSHESSGKEMRVIERIGDALLSHDNDTAAAHLCHLISGKISTLSFNEGHVGLLGADPALLPGRPSSVGSIIPVLFSMVYEAIYCAQHGRELPHLLPFRLIVVFELIGVGKLECALQHCEGMIASVRKVFEQSSSGEASNLFTAPFLACLEAVENRLRNRIKGTSETSTSKLMSLKQSLSSVFKRSTDALLSSTASVTARSAPYSQKERVQQSPAQQIPQPPIPQPPFETGTSYFGGSLTPPQSFEQTQPFQNKQQHVSPNEQEAIVTSSTPSLPPSSYGQQPAFNHRQPSFSQQQPFVPATSASTSAIPRPTEGSDANVKQEVTGWDSVIAKTIKVLAPADGDLSPPPVRMSNNFVRSDFSGHMGSVAPIQSSLAHTRSASVGDVPSFMPGAASQDMNNLWSRNMGGDDRQFSHGTFSQPPNFRDDSSTSTGSHSYQRASIGPSSQPPPSAPRHRRTTSDITHQKQPSEKRPPRPPKRDTGKAEDKSNADNSNKQSGGRWAWRPRLAARLREAFGAPKQAHMGEANQFVFDKEKGRWIIPGEDTDDAGNSPPPPPDDHELSNSEFGTFSDSQQPTPDISGTNLSRSASASNVATWGGSLGPSMYEDTSAQGQQHGYSPQMGVYGTPGNQSGNGSGNDSMSQNGFGDNMSESSAASIASAPAPRSDIQADIPPVAPLANKYRAGRSKLSGRRAYVDTFNPGGQAMSMPALAPLRPPGQILPPSVGSSPGGVRIFKPTPAPAQAQVSAAVTATAAVGAEASSQMSAAGQSGPTMNYSASFEDSSSVASVQETSYTPSHTSYSNYQYPEVAQAPIQTQQQTRQHRFSAPPGPRMSA